jgi:phage gp37-like protein
MLGDLENELIALIKESPLGKRLKPVDSLPDTPDKDVIKRWGVDAPAAYLVAMDGSITQAIATPQFVVVLVARNARSHQAARQGDGKTIGLYEMMEACIGELHGGQTDNASWQVTRYQFQQEAELRNQGLCAALVLVQADVDPPQKDGMNLGEFLEFHADFDIDPLTPGEHQRWLDENHDAPEPDLQSHINPQQLE